MCQHFNIMLYLKKKGKPWETSCDHILFRIFFFRQEYHESIDRMSLFSNLHKLIEMSVVVIVDNVYLHFWRSNCRFKKSLSSAQILWYFYVFNSFIWFCSKCKYLPKQYTIGPLKWKCLHIRHSFLQLQMSKLDMFMFLPHHSWLWICPPVWPLDSSIW